MDREQFLEQLAAPAGGKENIGLCDFRSGCLSVTVKDRSVIDLNAIRGLPGVADAELLRSRLRITLDQTIMEELQMAKKEDYGALAKQILSLVGGAENVSNATHCATRLRFNLKDESKADTDAIKGLAGVVGVAQANGQYQVIIGAEVTQVYEKLSGMLGTAPAAAAPAPKGKWYDRVIDTLTGIFTPILPPLTAAGMIKAVLAILVAFKLVSNTSSTYQVMSNQLEKIKELIERRAVARIGGGEKAGLQPLPGHDAGWHLDPPQLCEPGGRLQGKRRSHHHLHAAHL